MTNLPGKCPRCGKPLPANTPVCPTCPPERPADVLRPLGGPPAPAPSSPSAAAPLPPARPAPPSRPPTDEPLPPAPGEEPFGTWANIKSIVRLDPVFGVLLGLLALDLLINVVAQHWFGIVLSAAILWGVVTFQWWGYLIAMVLAGLGLVGGLIGLTAALAQASGLWVAVMAFPLAVNLFTLIVLYTRRERFD